MSKITRLLLVLVIAGFAGGIAFLATWDIPAPSQNVEKVIADDQFPK